MTTVNGRRRPPLQIRVTKEFGALIDTAARRDAGEEEREEGRSPAARALILIGAAALGRDMRHLRAEILKALSAPLSPDVEEALRALLDGATTLPPRLAAEVSAPAVEGESDGPLAGASEEPVDPFDVGQEF